MQDNEISGIALQIAEVPMNHVRRLIPPLSLFLLLGWTSNVAAQHWINQADISGDLVPFEEALSDYQAWVKVRVPQKSDGYKPASRALWFTRFRLNESGEFNPGELWKAWETSTLEAFETEGTGFTTYEWESLGPIYTRDYYSGGMGRINAIAEAPGDSNTIYIGSASGGVWVTHDGGKNWRVLTDRLPTLGVGDIIVHPTHPETVYLATGDPDSNIPTIFSAGILKSIDGGETWDTTGFGPSRALNTIKALVMHPDDPDRLFAATTIGLWTTDDGGASWQELSSRSFRDLDVSSDGHIWYAALSKQGIWRSTDDGESWAECRLPGLEDDVGRLEVAISPTETNVAYVAAADVYGTFIGLWRTEDSGNTWRLKSTTPNIFHWSLFTIQGGGQTDYNLAMAVDPDNSDHLFVGSVNLYDTHDSGETWEISATKIPLLRGGQMHADIHALQYFGGRLYAGHDGGISISGDSGETWSDISGGLVITQVHRLGLSQQGVKPEVVVTGNQDNGINLFRSGEWLLAQRGDGMECAVDPNNENLMYAMGANGNLHRTYDGGQKWYGGNDGLEGEAGAWVAPLDIHPDSSGILWRATGRIFVSRDSAATWQAVTEPLNGSLMSVMAVSPVDPQIQAAAAYDGDIHVTHDGWQTYETIANPGMQIQSLTFSPEDGKEKLLYVTTGGFRKDMGVASWMLGESQIWTNLSNGLPELPVNDLFIHPLATNWFFAATDLGVYASQDRGESWHRYGRGLPNVIVTEINWHERSNQLVISTYGRGIWTIPANPIEGYKLPATNLVAKPGDDPLTVTLQWTPPTQRSALLGYQIRLVGQFRVRVDTRTSYSFTMERFDSYSFAIDAIYPNGLSVSTDTVTVNLIDPYPEPEAVVAFVDENVGKASLQWFPPENWRKEFTFKYGNSERVTYQPAGRGFQVFFPVHEDLTVQTISTNLRSLSNLYSPIAGWHIDLVDRLSPTAPGERVREGTHAPQTLGYMGWISNEVNRQVLGGANHYLRVTLPLYYLDEQFEFGVDSTAVTGMTFHRVWDGEEYVWTPMIGETPMVRLVCSSISSVRSGGAGDVNDEDEEGSSDFQSSTVSGSPLLSRGEEGTSDPTGLVVAYEIRQNGRRIEVVTGLRYDFYYRHAGYRDLEVRALYPTGASPWVAAEVQKVDGAGNVLSTEPPEPGQVKRYSLSAVYPNPFNHVARATLNLPQATDVTMLIYNVRGDLVKRVDFGVLGAGVRTLGWDAQQVASGTYVIEVRAGEFRDVRKVMLIR